MIIVNFATHYYYKLQWRLRDSLRGHRMMLINDYGQIHSPSHKESPYQFKIHSIEKAFQRDDVVLWCDASLWRVGDISTIDNIIKTDGYFMEEAGAWVGTWTNQFTRDYFNMTENELAVPGGMYMFSAGFLGLHRQNAVAMEWFRQWKESALAGCFKGTWEDHRHDMTCGSIIAQRMGLTFQKGGTYLGYVGEQYPEPNPTVVFKLKGYI